MKIRSVVAVLALAGSLSFTQARETVPPVLETTACNPALAAKQIVGGVEKIQLYEIDYLARVDTGATTSSLNAYDITVDHQATERLLYFTTANEKGISKRLVAKIVKIETVRNAQGKELRYVVSLPIRWHKLVKTIEVNLRDRSSMQFSLLLGRNWLQNDFIVDIGKSE